MKKFFIDYIHALIPPYKRADLPLVTLTIVLTVAMLFAINNIRYEDTKSQSYALSTYTINVEAENGNFAGNVSMVNDSNASGGRYVVFGSGNVASVAAFPGAEGFGAISVGGRGGRVIQVTNLDDSGPGSFRDAVTQSGPRTVVFRVGGTITLASDINIIEPYLTIAGQTTPGGGIQFRGKGLRVQPPAHDITIRHIRIRRGWITNPGVNDVGLSVESGSNAGNSSSLAVYNVIVDHSSLGWQQDDNAGWGKIRNITFQWNFINEGNNPDSPFNNGISGKGLLLGAPPGQGNDMGTISIHHNFLASNHQRNPSIGGHGPTEVVNNVIYNWGAFGTQIQNRGTDGTKMNIIGNYYKAGPNTGLSRYEVLISSASAGVLDQLPEMIYISDNLSPHRTSSAQPEWALVGYCGAGGPTYCTIPASTSFQRSTPWPSSDYPISVSSVQENITDVLNNAGATLPVRDEVDARLVAEYNSGTGTIGGDNNWPILQAGTPPADSDSDGMSDTWETANGLNPNDASDGPKIVSNGYSNLENYINSL